MANTISAVKQEQHKQTYTHICTHRGVLHWRNNIWTLFLIWASGRLPRKIANSGCSPAAAHHSTLVGQLAPWNSIRTYYLQMPLSSESSSWTLPFFSLIYYILKVVFPSFPTSCFSFFFAWKTEIAHYLL